MPKQKLTAEFCKLIYCDLRKNKEEFFDTEIIGFTVEVRPSGNRTFYLRYTNQSGKQKQYRIGRYGDITFDQARKKARELKAAIVLGVGDPAEEKAEAKAVITYGELAIQHLAHAKTYQRAYDTTRIYVQRHLVPRWGKMRLSDIRQQDIGKWLSEKDQDGLAPATVEKIKAIFSRSFELALQWQLAGITVNPVRGINRPKFNNKRERFLSPEEVQRLLLACEASDNTQLRAVIGLLLYTGARVSELLFAEWKHVDVEGRRWLIPMSKTGKDRYVPLSKPALEIIEKLPRFDGCPYLVPNPKTQKPYSDLKRAWHTARTAAGLSDVRIHDLRHSAASFMINAGIDLFAVGRVLGHADHQSTMRYAHLANDTLLAAVEAGAKQMAG
ncbi:tyrosine-type recombinase/integrase [Parasphingorhabdus sp.]|uniref:tyrosine-type recombinase/integrase n=1 Tax=Parasphingorhabdus sp. TaxID=2709688 RepID=UPI003001F79A